MIIFISGPYRAKTENQVYKNIQAARNVAAELARNNVHFFCPHTHSGFMGGIVPNNFWLEMDIEFLKKCDAILMIGDWTNSSGSLAENEYAKNIGMKIYYNIWEAINENRKI